MALDSAIFIKKLCLMDEGSNCRFLYLSPVLASSDVVRDTAWYEQKLGFRDVYNSSAYKQGPVDYAVVGRQDLYLHLQFQYPEDMTSTDVRIQVTNIPPLFEEFVSKGIIAPDRLRSTSWNTREFGLHDPSGNRITFFEDI